MQRAFTYADNVSSGKIPAGLHIRNAVKRFREDLKRDDLDLREEAVSKVINFFASNKHFTGRHDNQPFVLEDWQVFIVTNIYGFYYKSTGKRRYDNAYIEIARKNGKTALGAVLAMYHLIADGEAAAEVLLAANSKDQAKIAYSLVKGFVKKLDPSSKYLRAYRADVFFDATDSFMKVLAADADTLDGYNCSFGLVDEYHSAPTPRVRDVIRSSQGMRENPLLVTITTAGFDKSLPCYDLRTTCTEIASGAMQEDNTFVAIFSTDQSDDWKDEASWVKSNPNLDVTVQRDFLKKEVRKAINTPAEQVGVRTKNFNEWMDTAETWIPDDLLLQSIGEVNIEDFKDQNCCVGVDLASVQDLTAAAYLFVKDDHYYFKVDYYLPEDSMNNRLDKETYKQWKREGALKTTSGNVTDYDYITKDMLDIAQITDILKVYYDKYNSTQWAIKATEENLPLEPYSQSIGNFNAPTKELERLILSGRVTIDNNPITRFCFRNVELKFDHNGNCKPNKGLMKKKIDGVIAIIQALAVWLENDEKTAGMIF